MPETIDSDDDLRMLYRSQLFLFLADMNATKIMMTEPRTLLTLPRELRQCILRHVSWPLERMPTIPSKSIIPSRLTDTMEAEAKSIRAAASRLEEAFRSLLEDIVFLEEQRSREMLAIYERRVYWRKQWSKPIYDTAKSTELIVCGREGFQTQRRGLYSRKQVLMFLRIVSIETIQEMLTQAASQHNKTCWLQYLATPSCDINLNGLSLSHSENTPNHNSNPHHTHRHNVFWTITVNDSRKYINAINPDPPARDTPKHLLAHPQTIDSNSKVRTPTQISKS